MRKCRAASALKAGQVHLALEKYLVLEQELARVQGESLPACKGCQEPKRCVRPAGALTDPHL